MSRALETASIAAAVLVVGVSYGALSAQAGLPAWLTVAMAVFVLAGSAELLFVGALLAGATPLLAAAGAVAVNLRNGVYGLTTQRWLRPGWQRLAGAHLVNDESVAYASALAEPAERPRAFWGMGVAVLCAWPLGAVLGTLLGRLVTDPAVLGLDAVFPTILLAMVLGTPADRRTAQVAAFGVVIAIAVTPSVPSGTAPLIALTALAAPQWRRARSAAHALHGRRARHGRR